MLECDHDLDSLFGIQPLIGNVSKMNLTVYKAQPQAALEISLEKQGDSSGSQVFQRRHLSQDRR